MTTHSLYCAHYNGLVCNCSRPVQVEQVAVGIDPDPFPEHTDCEGETDREVFNDLESKVEEWDERQAQLINMKIIRYQESLAESSARYAETNGKLVEVDIKLGEVSRMMVTMAKILDRVSIPRVDDTGEELGLVGRLYLLAAEFDEGFKADVLAQASKRMG